MVGIVASRLVERHHRPVVVVSLDGEGGGRGSGRSIPGFDLLAALEACAEHLEGFGGHRAAAGLTLRAENLDAFRAAFAAHAAAVLGPEDLRRTERIDAIVGGVGLGLELAEELKQLAPFGMGNPGVRLMVPSARVSDVRTMGEEGKHARFSLHSGAHRAVGVAFGRSSLGVGKDEQIDAAVRLEVNHWNGSVEPRVVLRELYPLKGKEAGAGKGAGAADDEAAPATHTCECDEAEWWARLEAERDPTAASAVPLPSHAPQRNSGGEGRVTVAGNGSPLVAVAELVSSGAGVLGVCADASRRAALAAGAAGLARFNGGSGRVACMRCGEEALASLLARAEGGFALTDYATVARRGPGLAEEFEHVVLIDPPPSAAARDLAAAGAGYLHELWTDAEREFAIQAYEAFAPSRQTIAAVFRRLREAGEASGAELRAALAGPAPHPLAPETAGRCLRVLGELELLAGEPNRGSGAVGVVSSGGTELERSAAFRAYSDDFSEAQRFLARPR